RKKHVLPAEVSKDQGGEKHGRRGKKPTWCDDVVAALRSIGGKGSLDRIYRDVEPIRRASGRSVPNYLQATVRQTLESHSSDSKNYKGGSDLFYAPEGIGAGVWALR